MNKLALKRSVDTLMIFLLPLLMAYSLIGEEVHEWLGIIMFGLFVCHHIMNINWIKNIFKGKYTAHRILMTAVNILLLIIMFALPITGILMSKYVLKGISAESGYVMIRQLHMCFAYWGLTLMCLHLSFHINVILKKTTNKLKNSTALCWVVRAFLAAVFCYGVFAFIKREIFKFLFMLNQFYFFDAEQSKLLFFLDYIAIMSAFVILGALLMKAVTTASKNKSNQINGERV